MTTTTIEELVRRTIKAHTHTGHFKLSSGGEATVYRDVRAAMLAQPSVFSGFFRSRLPENVYRVAATGTGGAIILACLAPDSPPLSLALWNPKGYGLEWSEVDWGLAFGRKVVVVDDVRTTGNTLRRLRAACEKRGWEVVGEIVAWPMDDSS